MSALDLPDEDDCTCPDEPHPCPLDGSVCICCAVCEAECAEGF